MKKEASQSELKRELRETRKMLDEERKRRIEAERVLNELRGLFRRILSSEF